MIAICTRQGAFIYDCSEAEADRRISNIEHSPAYNTKRESPRF